MDSKHIQSSFAEFVTTSELDKSRDFVLSLTDGEHVQAAILILDRLMKLGEPKAFFLRGEIHRWYGENKLAALLFLRAAERGIGSAYYFASLALRDTVEVDSVDGHSFCDLLRLGKESGHIWSHNAYEKNCAPRGFRSFIAKFLFRLFVGPAKLLIGYCLPKYREWMRY